MIQADLKLQFSSINRQLGQSLFELPFAFNNFTITN